jgi:erythromycin esterase-like protein
VPYGHWKTTTFVGALRHDRSDAPCVIDGPMTGQLFLAMSSSSWGEPGQVFTMRPALDNSHSGLFHRRGIPAFSLVLRGNASLDTALGSSMPQRAIGVVYSPETEFESHYIQARLPEQFDVVVFVDQSRAVSPL